MIMMVDDERCRLLPGEEVQIKKVRFRTLGCLAFPQIPRQFS
jgi:sulfate adenylyltransferase subunit 2